MDDHIFAKWLDSTLIEHKDTRLSWMFDATTKTQNESVNNLILSVPLVDPNKPNAAPKVHRKVISVKLIVDKAAKGMAE